MNNTTSDTSMGTSSAHAASLRVQLDDVADATHRARRTLREREHDRDRADRVTQRWNRLLTAAWTGITIGALLTVVGIGFVVIDAVTPVLSFGGVVGALLGIGLPVVGVFVVTVMVATSLDHEYIWVENARVGKKKMSRAEYTDYQRGRADESLDDLSDLLTRHAELTQELVEEQARTFARETDA